jgi:hypothetical protein
MDQHEIRFDRRRSGCARVFADERNGDPIAQAHLIGVPALWASAVVAHSRGMHPPP